MDISTTVSRKSSLSSEGRPTPNPKYKQLFASIDRWNPSPKQRLDANAYFKQEQSLKLLKTINGTKWQNGSYFFTVGKQHKDERFQEVFIDFFREIRGSDPLAIDASISLADRFRGYSDVSRSEEHTIDCGDFSDIQTTHYSPTRAVIDELKQILEDEYGLQGQFLGVLNLAGRKIGNIFKADTRDTCFHDFPIISRLFPRCVDTLREIFDSLLISKWLQNDIDGVKLYLNENDYIDHHLLDFSDLQQAVSLWTTGKHYGDQQKQRDIQLSKKHKNELKDDICGIAVSGGLSFITGNPTLVIGQAAKTVMNSLGNKIDPEGKDQGIQVLKMFGGIGLGGVMGGNTWDLGTSLGIDLVELAVRDKKTTKGESAALTLWGSVLKGALTGDQKKLVCQILGGCVAEAVNQLPETDENSSLEWRISRALLTNSDVQAHFIKGFVDKRFKDDPKPKTGGILTTEEQEKYPKQVITEIEIEKIIKEPEQPVKVEMQNEALYLKLSEEQKQNQADLKVAQADCEVKKQAAEKASKKEDNLHEKNKGFKLIPKPKLYQDWLDSKKTLATKNGEHQTSQGRVNEIQEKIYNNSKAQLVASTPKIPVTQTDKGLSSSITNLNRIDREIPEKILAVEKSIDNYNKHHRKDSYFSEVKRTIKDLNASFKDRDAEQNNINILNGLESNIETPLITIPKKASALAKIVLWCKDNVSLGIHPPTQPFNYDPNKPIPPESNKGSTYHETRHQINVEKSELNVLEEKSRPISQGSNWNSVSQYHSQRMFERNMAYQSPVTQPSPVDYQALWGQGVAQNVQLPPSDLSSLGRNTPEHRIPGMKHYPEGDRTQSNIPKWLRYFASGGETLDPQERIDRNTQALVATAKVAGQALGEIADELRSFGCVNAKFDQGRVTLRFDRTVSSQIDGLMDQFLPNMDHVPNFRYVEFTARIANDIMLQAFMMPMFQAQRAKPLLDRLLVRPQGFGQQVRAIEAFQQPALRSGFVSEVTVSRLTERHISKIKPSFYFSEAAAKQLIRSDRAIPMQIIQDIVRNPIAITKDPRRALDGSLMYYSRIYRNGKLYNVEVLYDKNLNKISHFKYDRRPMGPLEKIKK